jgi:hypothetical protein
MTFFFVCYEYDFSLFMLTLTQFDLLGPCDGITSYILCFKPVATISDGREGEESETGPVRFCSSEPSFVRNIIIVVIFRPHGLLSKAI